MWSDRRLVELFEIEHPIVLAPMAEFGTVELAAAVADAGGLGSIGCATMNPHFAVETIARLQRLTSKSININFFRHDPAKADADRERAWHDRLCSYYRELGNRPRAAASACGPRAVWRCHVRGRRGHQARGGELSLRSAGPGAAGTGQGGGLQGHLVGDDGRRSALAGTAWCRCRDCSRL